MTTYIDLTHTILHGMPVFPGEKQPSIIKDSLPEDAGYVTHRLESNFHTGTHMDAGWHVKADDVSIDNYPISNFVAKTCVIDVSNKEYIDMHPEWEQLFKKHEAVLFYTGQNQKWLQDDYYSSYPEFDLQIAKSLSEYKVRIVGFDSPSPDKSPFEFHTIYLGEGRFMIENMTNLGKLLNKTKITLLAFPLKIKAEASLIRAVAMVE